MEDNRRWMTIFEKINWVVNKSTDTHMADLCTGWGRIIYDNALNLEHYFTTYTGIDLSEELISEFMKNSKRKENNLFGDKIICYKQDVLEFDLAQNYFSLITGCWCLGFFDEDNILKLLEKVRNALAKDGVAVFKESITEQEISESGNEFYNLHP